MDQRDQFSKWMQAIEEALSDEKKEIAESMPEAGNQCGCGSWDCPVCFPEQDEAPGGVTPVVVAAAGCPACGQGAPICPACGQPHGGNQDGQLSPMSVPPQEGEVETEVPMQGGEFDGELEELSEPTVASYRDKATQQYADLGQIPFNKQTDKQGMDQMNREVGIPRANARLGLDKNDFSLDGEQGEDDYFNEPDPYDYDSGGAYGGRHDDYQSNLTARGFEEEGDPAADPDTTPSNGKPGVKLGHIVQKFEPVGGDPAGEESPLTYGEDNLDEEGYDDGPEPTDADYAEIENSTDPMVNPQHASQDVESIMYMQSMGLSMSDTHYDERELYTLTPEQLQAVKAEVLGGQEAPMEEDDMMQDMGDQTQQATGGTLGGAGAQAGGGGGGYAPGTAPTMPESVQRNNTMENIDSDIARIMKGFTKYDALKASKAIVSEKKKDEKEEKIDEEGNPWAKGGSKSDEAEDKKEKTTHKGGTVTKTETGIKHKGTYGDGKKDVKESSGEVDPEVLEWMQRFSKLGRMG